MVLYFGKNTESRYFFLTVLFDFSISRPKLQKYVVFHSKKKVNCNENIWQELFFLAITKEMFLSH